MSRKADITAAKHLVRTANETLRRARMLISGGVPDDLFDSAKDATLALSDLEDGLWLLLQPEDLDKD